MYQMCVKCEGRRVEPSFFLLYLASFECCSDKDSAWQDNAGQLREQVTRLKDASAASINEAAAAGNAAFASALAQLHAFNESAQQVYCPCLCAFPTARSPVLRAINLQQLMHSAAVH